MRTRSYNKVYTAGPVILQVMLKGQMFGVAVDLTPAVSVGTNHVCWFAIGAEFFFGILNVGFMRASYIEQRKQESDRVQKEADKRGWSVETYRERWS